MHKYLTTPSHLSFETIDHETIIIDLKKGHYHSLENLASTIWIALSNGISTQSIQDALLSHPSFPKENVLEDFNHFLNSLEEAEIADFVEQDRPSTPFTFTESVYEKPVMETFTDMEDLLLLDPIHETDEKGWPQEKKEAELQR